MVWLNSTYGRYWWAADFISEENCLSIGLDYPGNSPEPDVLGRQYPALHVIVETAVL